MHSAATMLHNLSNVGLNNQYTLLRLVMQPSTLNSNCLIKV